MKEVKKYLESRKGEYGFYFEELDCGYVYAYNENLAFQAGECIYLPLAIVLLKQIEEGNLNLNTVVSLTNKDIKKSIMLSCLKNEKYTVKELLIFMLMQNDSIAYENLMKILGANKFNNCMKELGINNTIISEKTFESQTTAYDISKCWNIINKTEYICKESKDFIINILKNQFNKNKIAFYYDKQCKENIACKNGNGNNNTENDSCYLNHSKGNFIFTILSQNAPSDVYGKVTLAKSGKMLIDIIENSWK